MGWIGPMTHRQFMVWMVWLNMENNQPSRSDYYAMQTAFYVARSSAKHPNSVRFPKFKLKFDEPNLNTKQNENREPTDQEIINAKLMSLSRIGRAKIRLPDGTPITKKQIIEMTMKDIETRKQKMREKEEERNFSNIALDSEDFPPSLE